MGGLRRGEEGRGRSLGLQSKWRGHPAHRRRTGVAQYCAAPRRPPPPLAALNGPYRLRRSQGCSGEGCSEDEEAVPEMWRA
jgi:hypothetical protein